MKRRPVTPRCWLAGFLLLALAWPWPALAGPATQPARPVPQTVVIGGTLEACPAYLRIHVQISQDGKPLSGVSTGMEALMNIKDLNDLDKLLDGKQEQVKVDWLMAYFDTGASACVISRTTADAFKLRLVPGAVYHEFGLHGETEMDVSKPYALAISDSSGKLQDVPGKWLPVRKDLAFQVNRAAAGNALMEMLMGPVDVIGMPAIKQFVVEVDPAPLLGLGALLGQVKINNLDDLTKGDLLDKLVDVGTGPAVTLHPAGFVPPNVDLEIPLHYEDYSRHENPADHGPRPTLEKNPVIHGVELTRAGKTFAGNWLLDTGAPLSIISTKQATALGLLDAKGEPTRQPDFEMPLGGVGGQVKTSNGFRVDRLRVKAAGGHVIEYTHVAVVVSDVTTKLDNGQVVTLDGVFGLNLLLPTVSGLATGLPTDFAAGPFTRVWIDGPGGRLLLQLAPPPPTTAPATAPAGDDLTADRNGR